MEEMIATAATPDIAPETAPDQPKKKNGAPYGNQNARKHAFYSRHLDAQEQADSEAAVLVEGVDEEIALLRIKIKRVLERDPNNVALIVKATNTLARLMLTRFNIRKEDKQGLKEAIGAVLREVALPLGIGIGAGMKQ